MKQWKKLLSIFMTGAVLITGGILPQKNAAIAEGVVNYGISNPRIENGVTTWDKIKFGSYYQEAEVQPEPIKWRVLSVDENSNALLLADKILDCKSYNKENGAVTWETCTLRKWLNEDFYNEAFDDEEKKAVMETVVINENNPEYDTEGGNDTKDKVYLLSIAEASNAEYGFGTQFDKFEKRSTRTAKNTDYVKVNNPYINDDGFANCFDYWWLRSPGYSNSWVSYVSNAGCGDYQGNNDSLFYGVRPALHINLSSSKVTNAGEVDSEGNVTASTDKIRAPRVKDGVTTWDCVYFGNYKQTCTFKKQDIEWRVLSVDEDDALLLSDMNLDCKPYNEKYEDVTWETCTLRKWLNEDFYSEAFDSEEKKAVMETMVVNENNPFNDTNNGNDTNDKVYLLSITEAANEKYGFDTEFRDVSETRTAKNTDYAKVNNAASMSNSFGYWWLRSLGCDSMSASKVNNDGCGDGNGGDVYVDRIGVRPALHIDLSSSSWSKVGEVSSAEQGDDKPTATHEPTKEPLPTDKPISSTVPEQTQAPTVTVQPTPPSVETQNPLQTAVPVLKQLRISSIKCAKNAKKITGKVSVSKASIKIKVGKKAYKKATLKGKKFSLKLNYKLKKKTKIKIKVTKKGYKTLIKYYNVK